MQPADSSCVTRKSLQAMLSILQLEPLQCSSMQQSHLSGALHLLQWNVMIQQYMQSFMTA
jgi:hypothetical protein